MKSAPFGFAKMKQRRSAVAAVISELRQKYVTMVEPEKLNTLEITTDGRLRPKRRPGALMSRSKKKSQRDRSS